jgi:hypothetical protein
MSRLPHAPLPPGLDEDFEVVRPLGAGGMGAVWLVRDRFLGRLVALKVLLEEHATPDLRERFLREARTSARLEHPHIIDVYRADETNGVVWFTMRFIDGESLGDRIRERGPMPVSDAVRILREVAWGLGYAHARGVIHRDIKPDNILLDRGSGRAVLTDFGVARDELMAASDLTLDGHVMGTVHFMSPEQAADEPLDGRSDIYALGCVAYLMLSGRVPFDGSAQGVLVSHVTKPIVPLRSIAPHIPPSVCEIIECCLRKDRTHRFSNADALATALDSALRDAQSLERAEADAAPGAMLSEADAISIWQRAAQLQAEAAHRMERAPKLRLATSDNVAAEESSGYRLRDVEAAAMDAGISRQYVALALAENQRRDSSLAPLVVDSRAERQFTTMLGTRDRSISVSRVIADSPKNALAAIGAVFTTDPYRLRLEETVNGHPLDGGIMRFTSPGIFGLGRVAHPRKLIYRMQQIDLDDLNVTLHARGTAERPSCEVIITGDLRKGLKANLRMDWGIMGVGGAAAGIGGTAALSTVLGSSALAVIPGAGIAALVSGGAMLWYRWLFRNALREARQELSDLLLAVERHLSQRDVFRFDPPDRLPLNR